MSLPAAVAEREARERALHARAAVVCSRLNRAHADLVALTAQLLEDELWGGVGIRSPQHWLCVYAGLSPFRAGEIVRLAQRREQLPEALAAMADGRLSIDQAAVATYVPASHSAEAAGFAEQATVSQLRRSLSRYAFTEPATDVPEPTAGEADQRDPIADAPAGQGLGSGEPVPDGMPDSGPDRWGETPSLSMSTRDGRFTLHYSAPASLGALVEQAIREAKDALFACGQTDATLADGLVEVANRSLSCIAATPRADKYRIYVHLDTDGGWIGTGGRLPAHQLQRLTCQGVLRPVWETDATPVSVGRAMRIVTEVTRRLVEARDQGCRYPGCATTSILDNQHLIPWSHGGRTDADALICLCPYHHDRLHDGDYHITGDPTRPGGLRFTTPGGWPIAPLAASAPEQHRSAAPSVPAEPDDDPDPPTWVGPTPSTLA